MFFNQNFKQFWLQHAAKDKVNWAFNFQQNKQQNQFTVPLASVP
jgi:hypothetical protein